MVSQKKRLYIALYPSGVVNNEERKYHWAFLVGPKIEDEDEVPGTRYHVKNSPMGQWTFEETKVRNVKNTISLLARILIGKIEDEERLIKIFRELSIVHNDPNWRCRTWVAKALDEIKKDGKAVGTSVLDWEKIEKTARKYVGDKAAGGRYQTADDLRHPKPTWDMLENKERLP
ncbi:hypothetical protein McanMca71_007917 [Microsporum canis]|uniref:Uncharacterized protein n=1 Tax=Arthroderma otae (strain ATCC MYA-4605 / CBS 113480) TaxID=554155 RepID=C5FIW9_ARTOC|nr:conserved hypothetical protein [Microsporum canis CBS 113480]EEQ29210.1 conserved hypothetical protein [Microsporum canis CBS 113480]